MHAHKVYRPIYLIKLVLKTIYEVSTRDQTAFISCYQESTHGCLVLIRIELRDATLITALLLNFNLFAFLFVLRFYGPVNTIKALSSRSVNLSTLSLGRLSERLTSIKYISDNCPI